MIQIFSLLFSLIIFTNANAELVETIVPPQGDYATIKVSPSIEVIEIFRGKNQSEKKKAATKIESKLGDYNPVALVELGIYYLSQKEFNKAVLYITFGMLRAKIDVTASRDLSLEDVIPIMNSWVNTAAQSLTKEEMEVYQNATKNVVKDIIPLDKRTPRNYDIRWASLHSIRAFTGTPPPNYYSPQEYNELIEKEHLLFKESAKKQGGFVEENK